MKRLTIKQKNRLIYACKRETKKRIQNNRNTIKKHTKAVLIPKIISLQTEKWHEELCLTIDKIKKSIAEYKIDRLTLDFRRVEKITADGMILLYSELDIINRLKNKTKLRLIPPIRSRPSQVLIQIKLYELLGKLPHHKPLTDPTVINWTATSNTNAEPKGWATLTKNPELYKHLYTPVIEAITNSCAHAYIRPRNDFFKCESVIAEKRKWWMFSQTKDGELHVALADLGVGFSGSIDREHVSHQEWFREIISKYLKKRTLRIKICFTT